MGTETSSATPLYSPLDKLQHAIVGGLVAGVVMGVMVQLVLERMTAIGALYTLGDPSLTVGWAAHLFHSVVFATFFALFDGSELVSEYVDGVPGGAISGAIYGTALWAVNIVVLWPLWLGAVSLQGAPTVPYLAPRPLVGHLLYGVLLGGTVAVLRGRTEPVE